MPMMQLGNFAFETSTIAYQSLSRSKAARFERTQRHLARAATQYTGPGEEKISLPFKIFPGTFGRAAAIETIDNMIDAGESYLLVSGTGKILGNWTIENITEEQSNFFSDGVARQSDGTIELMRV